MFVAQKWVPISSSFPRQVAAYVKKHQSLLEFVMWTYWKRKTFCRQTDKAIISYRKLFYFRAVSYPHYSFRKYLINSYLPSFSNFPALMTWPLRYLTFSQSLLNIAPFYLSSFPFIVTTPLAKRCHQSLSLSLYIFIYI